jgi:hypothetical protein
MISPKAATEGLSLETQGFYRDAVRVLNEWEIPFLLGGAYALAQRTGIVRHTKDLDIFLLPEDARPALRAFRQAGYRAELTFEHWLGKVFCGEDFVDLIFSSGNGIARVDLGWFEYSDPARVFGQPVRLIPVEEMIWSKAFICERERFDGADINHLLLACGRDIDWNRLLGRFDEHWRVLLSHLILFGYSYPGELDAVPRWVMDELTRRLGEEEPDGGRVCRGTLLSRIQYVRDLEKEGYADGRLGIEGGMTPGQADAWTEAGLRGK